MFLPLMRIFCLVFSALGILMNSHAQTKMPTEFKIPLQLSLKEYTSPKLYYGIKPLKSVVELIPDVYFRNFRFVYDAGFLSKPVADASSEMVIGFIGFKQEFIAEIDTLWCKPSDTTIQPCLHNLLSDVFLNNLGAFDTFDPEDCNLCIVNSQSITNPKLKSSLGEHGENVIFLFWNKEKHPVMPASFPVNDMTCTSIANPIKIPRGKAVAQKAVPPATIKVPATEKLAATPKTSPSTQPLPVKKAPSEKTNIVNQPDKIVKQPDNIVFAPQINSLLIPEIVAFTKQKKFSFNENEMTLALSKMNDTLIICAKDNGKLLKSIPILVRSVPYTIEQAMSNRRLTEPDAESKFLNARQSKKLVISYKGQGLTVTPSKKRIFVPEFVSTPDEIVPVSSLPVSVKVVKNSSNVPDSIKIFFNYEKKPLKLSVNDQKLLTNVNGFQTEIWYSQKIKVFVGKLNSGDEIPGLFLGDSLYSMLICHPDYKNPDPSRKIFITHDDFNTGKTVFLDPEPGFNVIYVEPKNSLRQTIVDCIDDRLMEIKKNHQPFMLFVSNTSNPLVIKDPDKITETVDRISELFDDAPNLNIDYSSFSENLKAIEGLEQQKIILQVYCSVDLFHNGGNEFVDRIVNDLLKGVFNNNNTEIWLYTNTELDDAEKKSLLNYHYYTFMKE
jgi:hypothetical protein